MNIPEQYKEAIQDFVIEYLNDRSRQIENNFMIVLPFEAREHAWKNWDSTPLGHQLAEIALAAAGQMTDDPEGWNRGVVYEGIQDLMEQLFAPPGLGSAYTIPESFWEHPLGEMVALAFLWVQQDEAITQAEAAQLTGASVQSINNAIRQGKLRKYTKDVANPRQGGTLVGKKQVMQLFSK